MADATCKTDDEILFDWLNASGDPGGAPPETIDAVEAVLMERRRQILAEGWIPAHDDGYDEGQLARAAAAYAISAATPGGVPALSASMFGCQIFPGHANRSFLWPWEPRFWKPKDPRRDLVRAAALILAEIERIDRAAARAADEVSRG